MSGDEEAQVETYGKEIIPYFLNEIVPSGNRAEGAISFNNLHTMVTRGPDRRSGKDRRSGIERRAVAKGQPVRVRTRRAHKNGARRIPTSRRIGRKAKSRVSRRP